MIAFWLMPYLVAFEPGINLPSKNWSSYDVMTIELLLESLPMGYYGWVVKQNHLRYNINNWFQFRLLQASYYPLRFISSIG